MFRQNSDISVSGLPESDALDIPNAVFYGSCDQYTQESSNRRKETIPKGQRGKYEKY